MIRKFILTMVVILSAFVSAKAEEPNTTDYFYINDFTIAPGETKEIELCLYSTQPYRSLQVNIYMPEGLEIVFDEDEYEYIIPSDRIPSRNWPYQSDFVADGSLLVSAYSSNNRVPITAGDGALFTMKVKASETLEDCVIGLRESEMTGHVAPYVNYAFYGPNTECHVSVVKPVTLAGMVADKKQGATYAITDPLTCVYVSDDGKTLFAKDENGFAGRGKEPYVVGVGQTQYDDPSVYDQSNWVEIELDEPISGTGQIASILNHKISGITGALVDDVNYKLKVKTLPEGGEQSNYTPNLYCPANFVEQEDYFFMPPKPQEFARIRWAVYHDGAFYLPQKTEDSNVQDLCGAVRADLDAFYSGEPLVDGTIYELTAIIRAIDSTQPANKNVTPKITDLSTQFEIYPISAITNDIITSIEELNAGVLGNGLYYDMLGRIVKSPTPGIYIHNGRKVVVK